ncbi:MAG: hypothetical protein PHW50_00090 [Patescibacteria group bacterium]|nr:hypothetical protein [Patescibacteria group bacterium]
MGKNDGGILGALGELAAGFANEVDIFNGSNSNSSGNNFSGNGSHYSGDGSSAGHSESGGLGTNHFDSSGRSSGHTISVGDRDYHYAGGYMGWIDGIFGSNQVGQSVHNGSQTVHYGQQGQLIGQSIQQDNGSIYHYDDRGNCIGRTDPLSYSDRVTVNSDQVAYQNNSGNYSSDERTGFGYRHNSNNQARERSVPQAKHPQHLIKAPHKVRGKYNQNVHSQGVEVGYIDGYNGVWDPPPGNAKKGCYSPYYSGYSQGYWKGRNLRGH